jgi:hypothetical protein
MKLSGRFSEDPIVCTELAACEGRNVEHWETIGEIETLKDHIKRDRACSGVGWFHVVMKAGAPALRLCSTHAARAILRDGAESCRSVILRCPRCAHIGSSTEGGREYCNRCGAELEAPRLKGR